MANKASPRVPPGLKWCHGCSSAIPVERFALRACRGRTVRQSRCGPCLTAQRQEQRVTARKWHAHWTELEEARRKAPPVPLRLPEELDSGPLSIR